MSETRHVCGLRGFGLAPDDECPACHTPAPRDPAAGATPAREETLAEELTHLVNISIAFAHGHAPLDAIERRKASVHLAALRERDAAREDAARLDWLEAQAKRADSLVLGWSREDHDYDEWAGRSVTFPESFWVDDETSVDPPHPTLRAAIDAARAATAEGRTP